MKDFFYELFLSIVLFLIIFVFGYFLFSSTKIILENKKTMFSINLILCFLSSFVFVYRKKTKKDEFSEKKLTRIVSDIEIILIVILWVFFIYQSFFIID